MEKAIYNYLIATLSALPREDAENVFAALYLHTDAATVHTVGYAVGGSVYAVRLYNTEYRPFLHWNTTSAKNGKDGDREPRLRVRIPKKAIFPSCFSVCAETELLDRMQTTGKNKGECFEEILTGTEKDANTPYFIAPDSPGYGSIKYTEATACTLSALASALANLSANRLQYMSLSALDLPVETLYFLNLLAWAKRAVQIETAEKHLIIEKATAYYLDKNPLTPLLDCITMILHKYHYNYKGVVKVENAYMRPESYRYYIKYTNPFYYLP